MRCTPHILRTLWSDVRHLLMALLLLFCVPHLLTAQPREPPRAVAGVLDLRGWDFHRDGVVTLRGEWEFYWGNLYAPSQFPQRPERFLEVPLAWNYEVEDATQTPLPTDGFATYRLRVLLDAPGQLYHLYFGRVSTAYTAFVDGRIVQQVGSVGPTAARSRPATSFQGRVIQTNQPEVEIVVHVSNFHHRDAGLWEAPRLELVEQFQTWREQTISIALLLAGSAYMMALYQFGIYIHRRREQSILYFTICCLCVGTYVSIDGGLAFGYQAYLSWDLRYRLLYLGMYWGYSAFNAFIASVFAEHASRWFLRINQGAASGLGVLVCLTSPRVFTDAIPLFYALIVGSALYTFYLFQQALQKQTKEALPLVVGFVICTALIANDILVSHFVIDTPELAPIGIFVMVLSQAFMLAMRFSTAYADIERLSGRLESQNQELLISEQRKDEALQRQRLELEEAQGQLVQQEKMVGLGTLVAGVAHEINNPANFVIMGASVLERDLKAHQKLLRELLEEEPEICAQFEKKFHRIFAALGDVKEGTDRIKFIVSDLRQFSRLDEADRKVVPLLEGLESTIRLAQPQYRGDVKIEADFRAAPSLDCWPARLNQVFMNMLVNACQAILKRAQEEDVSYAGKVTVRVQTVENEQGAWALVSFLDNGCGMDEATQRRIFEPFYTTQEVGSGVGMGLYLSFEIVQKHGGRIEMQSVPQEGSRFTIWLPIRPTSADSPSQDPDASLREPSPERGSPPAPV